MTSLDARPARRAALRLAGLAAVLAILPSGARAADGATAPIERLSAALGKAGRAEATASFEQRMAALTPAVDEAFDLPAVLRASVGPKWDALPTDDQQRLQTAFRRYTVASYVANLAAGDAPKVSPETRALPGGEQVVDTQVGDIKLSYVMRQGPAGWRAVDVLTDGSISRVAVQRSDFRAQIEQGGGGALLASLERKVSELAG